MDIIIVILIVVLIMFGLRSVKKHIKGQSGCCCCSNTVTPIQEKKSKSLSK